MAARAAVVTLHALRGHTLARASLDRAREHGTLPEALLLHGAAGIGKQRLALWLAQLVLCEAPGGGEPCGSCRSCKLTLNLEHPDIHWFFPLARPKRASSPQKLAAALERNRYAELSELRENPLRPSHSDEPRAIYLAAAKELRRRAHRRPSMSAQQFFILANAETLVPQESSPEAANALLKLLEEPPAGARFVLTSSEPGRLLTTIRSRVAPLHLNGLSIAEVEEFLVDEGGKDPEAAGRAARLSNGSIGQALGFLPNGEDLGPLERLRQDSFALIRAALSDRPGDAFRVALSYKVTGARALSDLFVFVDGWLRDLATASSGEGAHILNFDARDFLERTARERGTSPVAVAKALALVEEAREQSRGNVNPQLIVAGLIASLRRSLGGTRTLARPNVSSSLSNGP